MRRSWSSERLNAVVRGVVEAVESGFSANERIADYQRVIAAQFAARAKEAA